MDWNDVFRQMTNQGGGTTEPNAAARNLAQINWQHYTAHVQAGFTPDQAMHLVACMLSTAIMQGMGDTGGNEQ